MPTTSQETLKTLSDAIDAFAAAKMANNESLIRYSIAQIQEFINGHNITPVAAEETGSLDLSAAE